MTRCVVGARDAAADFFMQIWVNWIKIKTLHPQKLSISYGYDDTYCLYGLFRLRLSGLVTSLFVSDYSPVKRK